MSTTTASEPLSHAHSDYTNARIGMWLFLFTEILLFGGLFLLYAVYRSKFPADFHFCAGTLDTFLGAVNTAVLLTGSLTMVLAVAGLEKKNRKPASLFLGLTIFLGFVFLVNKFFEWSAKIEHGIFPNSEVLQSHPAGENIFYSLYYLMTGLHGLHVVIAVVILSVMTVSISRTGKSGIEPGEELDRQNIRLENSSLYWQLVTITWIFLFPLFYLIT
jgi:cytochrome c oxidase subunit 3